MGFFSFDSDDEDLFDLFEKIFVTAFIILFPLCVVLGILEAILKLYLGFSLADNFPDLLDAIKSWLLK